MTDIQKENKSGGKVPNLRFPEFKEGWEVKKLGEISTNKSKKYNPNNETNFIKCIELEHLSSETGQLLGFVDGSQSGSIKNVFQKGDVLFGKLRPYLKKYYQPNFDGVCSSEIWVLNGKEILNDFLYYLIQTNSFVDLANQSSGSKMPRADWSILENGLFSFPNSEEQQKIASFLSLIDERIQTQNKIIEQLETLIKGLSENLFSQKIRFKKFEKKWEVKTLGEILIEINERTINSNQYRVLSSTAKGLFYQSDYFNKEVASKDSAGYKILKFNQLVFSPQNLWLGNINVNTTYEIGIVSPSYKVFSFNEKAIVSYCKYFLKSSKMMFEYEQCSEQGASIVRRNLNMDLFLNIPILLPKLEEQIQISSFLTKIDQKIQTEKAILEQLEIQKKYLLQQMFV